MQTSRAGRECRDCPRLPSIHRTASQSSPTLTLNGQTGSNKLPPPISPNRSPSPSFDLPSIAASLHPPLPSPAFPSAGEANKCTRFEYRRNMQEVLSNVFLGPLQVARNNTTLHANRITLLIPVRTPNTARFLSVPKDDDGRTWPAFCVDIQHEQIMTWFYKVFSKVKEEVERGGTVLIYCENGNGLSAAMCVALVMDTRLYPSLLSHVDADAILG